MDICKKLHTMKRDEAGGILCYNKIKSLMPLEHSEHVAAIETYIEQEYDHLQGVEKIMAEMGCKDLSPVGEMCLIGKEIYERANEIEKIARSIGGEEGRKVHKLTEEIEMKVREIHSIVRHIPMEKEITMENVEEVLERETKP